MKKLILSFLILFPFYLSADFDNKCSVLITLRFQSNDDAYKDALNKIQDVIDKYRFVDDSVIEWTNSLIEKQKIRVERVVG